MEISEEQIKQLQEKRQEDLNVVHGLLSSKFQERIRAKIDAEFLAITGITQTQEDADNARARLSNRLDPQFFQQVFFPEV